MKRRIILIPICFLLASCDWFIKPDPPAQPKQILHLNLPNPIPLDLSKYKELKLAIKQYEDSTSVCIDYRDVSLLMELLAVLEGRIDEQRAILDQYRNYYESE